MKAQDLKNSILQLAIQGKLVEQREEEGTAKELIEKIKVEKEKLIKEAKIKKEKPLPEITEDEIPFDIPESWEWVRFGEVVNVVSARRVHQSDWRKSGIPFYRAREIGKLSETGYVDNELYIDEELFNKFSESGVPQPGDLMVTAVGTLGKTYIVKEADRFYYKDASVICFENFSGISSMYLKYIMESKMMEQQIKSNSGGTTVATLTMVRTNMYVLPIPPLEEQKRIVAKIEELLPYVDQYDKAYTEVEELNKKFPEDMQKSILQYAIQGKLVEQREEDGTAEELYQIIQAEKEKLIKEGKIKKTKPLPAITEDEIPFDIPENWKWVRFNDISCIHGTGLVRSNYEQFQKADYEYFKMNNIENFTGSCNLDNMPMIYATEEEYKRYKLEEGDFLFNTRNSRELVGKTAVVQNISDRKIILNNNILKISFHRNISSKYINYYFISPLGRDQLRKFITNTTNVAAIYQKQLITLMIPIPPFEEQKRIAERIEELFPYTKQLVKKLD